MSLLDRSIRDAEWPTITHSATSSTLAAGRHSSTLSTTSETIPTVTQVPGWGRLTHRTVGAGLFSGTRRRVLKGVCSRACVKARTPFPRLRAGELPAEGAGMLTPDRALTIRTA
jgi:hypothetical protein